MADTFTPNPSLRIASHNVQGMNLPVKRQKFSQYYHTQKIDILFLQETHLPHSYSPSYIYPKFRLPNAETKTKGVTIFIFSSSCNFSLTSEFKDPEGRFLLVKGLIDGQLYSLVS